MSAEYRRPGPVEIYGRHIELGGLRANQEFQPFAELTKEDLEGLEEHLEKGEEYSDSLITAHFSFMGVPGFLTLFRTYPPDWLSTERFLTPLGEVRAALTYEDGLTYVRSIPVGIQLRLEDIQLGHIDELAKYALQIRGEDPRACYIPCAGREEELELIKRQAYVRGRADIVESRDIRGDDIVLPHSVSKLIRIKAKFMERSQILRPRASDLVRVNGRFSSLTEHNK